MFAARLATILLAALALAPSALAAHQAAPRTPGAPQDLKAFLLRSDEPAAHEFPRTPSFAWTPVSGAIRYEFELSKNPNFNEGGIFWSNAALRSPTVAIPLALPWMTGNPYAVYAHVRAVTRKGATPWSDAYGFNVRWGSVPVPSTKSYPGMVSWTVVDGATSYDVWFTDIPKVISTKTNSADEREYYDFHQNATWTGSVHWRVRAVRNLYGVIPNGLPAVTYGPWSRMYTSLNPPFAVGPMDTAAAVSDVSSPTDAPAAHRLTPGFAFTGNTALNGNVDQLYRVYVFSDSDCVNVVFRGAIVGSPAYAPRTSPFTRLPNSDGEIKEARTKYLLQEGTENKAQMADTAPVQPTELDAPLPAPSDGSGSAVGGTNVGTPPTSPPGSTTGGSTTGGSTTGGTTTGGTTTGGTTTGGTTTTGGSTDSGTSGGTAPVDPGAEIPPANAGLPGTPRVTGAPVDLWDSGWPNGRFYWTVVPVDIVIIASGSTTLTAAAPAGSTTITVGSTTGFSIGALIGIGNSGVPETATIKDVSGDTITLTAPLVRSHVSDEQVLNSSPSIEYHDAELPQDACAAGRIASFGKTSEPALASATTPYASGLSPNGRLTAATKATPSFYGYPLVAWQPALGADEYQVQWSPTKYPWNPVDAKTGARLQKLTYGTSVLLPLTPGTWYYRVRGFDFFLPGTARAMSWSDPAGVVVTKPKFKIVSK